MFGLDARIALAIFGALSVISGAALYSAIKQARATAFLTEMKEIGKAWESYYIDTGGNLPQNSLDSSNGQFYWLKNNFLVEKPAGESNWNGPYLSYDPMGYALKDSSTGHKIYMGLLKNEDSWNDWIDGRCLSGKNCSVWGFISEIEDDAMALGIDSIVDNSDGLDKGAFRWFLQGNSTYAYMLKVAPIKNPND
ncbi:MAG TPA: hypothetical protein DCL21_05875 [Alphaproteobacteria bacterium]|nr:hypothetical protein [Alphaproteobacteria bacterium]